MLKILSFILFLYALACLFLYVKQRSILYFPSVENSTVNATNLEIKTTGVTLKLWKINQAKTAIIYFGGNSEAVEGNLADFKQMFNDFSVYLVNYRGYGGSSGSPTEKGLFEDALAIYDQLKTTHSTISVIGRSLGSGVASYLAANRDVDKLALITPYDSISNVAQSHYPFIPVKWLIKDRFNSTLYAPSITAQTLVLYAESDQVVPMVHTKSLLKVLPDARSLLIEGSAHNDISSNLQYQKLLSDFFTL